MFTVEALAIDRPWPLEEVPPEVRALLLTEATLKVLPEQLMAAGSTGQFKPDPPEVAEIFQNIETRYRRNCYGSFEERVWRDGFCRAFALLLEGTAPRPVGLPRLSAREYHGT